MAPLVQLASKKAARELAVSNHSKMMLVCTCILKCIRHSPILNHVWPVHPPPRLPPSYSTGVQGVLCMCSTCRCVGGGNKGGPLHVHVCRGGEQGGASACACLFTSEGMYAAGRGGQGLLGFISDESSHQSITELILSAAYNCGQQSNLRIYIPACNPISPHLHAIQSLSTAPHLVCSSWMPPALTMS